MLMKSNTRNRAGWFYLLAAPLVAGMVLLSGWSASAQDPDRGQKDEMKARIEKDLNMTGFTKTSEGTWVKDGVTVTRA